METAKKAFQAGADILVSGNYILNHPNPKKAFEELNSI
jgi:orotidine-5'-phosphate decarboxylase